MGVWIWTFRALDRWCNDTGSAEDNWTTLLGPITCRLNCHFTILLTIISCFGPPTFRNLLQVVVAHVAPGNFIIGLMNWCWCACSTSHLVLQLPDTFSKWTKAHTWIYSTSPIAHWNRGNSFRTLDSEKAHALTLIFTLPSYVSNTCFKSQNVLTIPSLKCYA